MAQPNTLIFVDIPSDDTVACAEFYHDVFGWEVEGRPTGVFHRAVPGGYFPLEDGSDSPIGNLHLGIYDVANARPHPDPAGVEPRHLSKDGRTLRLWILVSDDDSEEAILARAEKHGAKILWRDHYWAEFNGFNGAFEDPWGNTIVCWTKGGPNPVIGEGKTSE
jgi:predicted enzyme related to lactoylglutathione lyase